MALVDAPDSLGIAQLRVQTGQRATLAAALGRASWVWLAQPNGIQRPALVLCNPFGGCVAVGAEHRHRARSRAAGHRRSPPGLRRRWPRTPAGQRDPLLRGASFAKLSSPQKALPRNRRPPPIGPPPQAQRRRVVRRVTPVPGPLPRPLSALALAGFVGFEDAINRPLPEVVEAGSQPGLGVVAIALARRCMFA